MWAVIRNCSVGKDQAPYCVTTACEFCGNNKSDIYDCQVLGETQGFWINQGNALSVTNCTITTTIGNGIGGIRMDGACGTLNLYNVYTFRGDWGLYIDGSATFVFIMNFQINNPRAGGVYCKGTSGHQFWANQLWVFEVIQNIPRALG